MSPKMNAYACSMPDNVRVQKAEVTMRSVCPAALRTPHLSVRSSGPCPLPAMAGASDAAVTRFGRHGGGGPAHSIKSTLALGGSSNRGHWWALLVPQS